MFIMNPENHLPWWQLPLYGAFDTSPSFKINYIIETVNYRPLLDKGIFNFDNQISSEFWADVTLNTFSHKR